MFVPMLLMVGSAIDFSTLIRTKLQVQDALDAAVLRGVQDPAATRVATATQFLQGAMGPTLGQLQQFTYQFTTAADGSFSGTAHATVPTNIMAVAGITTMTVGAQSVAQVTAGGSGGGGAQNSVCILLLDPSSSQTLLMNSGAGINAPGCEVDVATTATTAAIFNGNTTLNVAKTCLQGSGYIDNGGTHPNVVTRCTTVADPFANKLPAPPSTTCTNSNGNYNGGQVTLSPGVYCGWFNFNSSPTVTLQPGVYVIQSGGWNVNGGTWTGTGVTFYFADTSKIQFNSGMNMNLSAPTSGTYSGILFYEKSGLSRSQIAFNDSVSEKLTGLIYLPSRDLTFNSTSNLSSPSLTLVANSAIFNSVNWSLTAGPKTVGGSTTTAGTASSAYRIRS